MPPGGKVRSGVVTLSRIACDFTFLAATGNIGDFSRPFKINQYLSGLF